MKVLVADDETEILAVLARKVEAEGWDAVTARTGLEAWDKIKSENPDIIVMDLTMPDMDGLEILRGIKDNPPSDKNPPIIIVSARNAFDDMQKGYDLDADHYIPKPCQPSEIIQSIHQMIRLLPLRKSQADLKAGD